MPVVLCFLQNAWSPVYAGRLWPRESWLKALHLSRSGQRLKVLTAAAPDYEFHFDNTTPLVGKYPSTLLPPDLKHITTVIKTVKPKVIVTCGSLAAWAVTPLAGELPVLQLPHPAYRVVTNRLFKQAGELLQTGFSGVVEAFPVIRLKQKIDYVETIKIQKE